MMTIPITFSRSTAIGVIALAVASSLFTLGFACAAPLAAFAAIAAMAFNPREALMATGAAWLVHQGWGFAVLHYPMNAETIAWGGALGIIAALSCAAAGRTTQRFSGAAGACASFLVAFGVYEGALIAVDFMTGQGGEDVTPATVARIFLINACAFGGLWALKAIVASTASDLKLSGMPAPRRV